MTDLKDSKNLAGLKDNLPQETSLLLYENDDGSLRVDVRLYGETVWLTQIQMAELFDRERSVITKHIGNVFSEGELEEKSVCAKFAQTAADGKTYDVTHYNLDVIISVGYRVKSPRGTRFRQWATERLREYIVKGFTMDDQRLAEGRTLDDYFDELIERVRTIRTSERNFYRKITDIYATSIDYDADAEITNTFFATVQNKMHYAIHGHTAAEIVHKRADAAKPNMGLTSYKGSRIRKSDVSIAKNFLLEEELKDLNLIVDQYLSFAESQARRRKPMSMKNWVEKLDGFLTLNDREILDNPGMISHAKGKKKAEDEFERFKAIEDQSKESDFDRFEKEVEVYLPGKSEESSED